MSKDPDNRELQLFRELLELSSYALGCDGRQFYTQFYGRLMQFMKEEENQRQYPVSGETGNGTVPVSRGTGNWRQYPVSGETGSGS